MPSFKDYVRSAHPIIWVNTLEPHRAEEVLAIDIHEFRPQLAHWDILQGEGTLDGLTGALVAETVKAQPSPVAALKAGTLLSEGVTFLWNFHRFMSSTEVVQGFMNAIPLLKAAGSSLVILAPDADKLPAELARHIVVWEFPLPDRAQLKATIVAVSKAAGDIGVAAESEAPLLEAMLGLTAGEAEDALSLSVVESMALEPAIVAREKGAALLRQSKLTLENYPDRFVDLGGLETLKAYALATANSRLALGLVLLGVPGSGKSSWAKALGNELQRPTLSMDFGKMMGSLVGSSEAAIRGALAAVDKMGKCILFIDEIDKGLAGAGSSGNLDSGVKAGVAGTFLRWLSDREPGLCYVIATANNVQNIPPEYLRAERWDALFFIDLPTRAEKDAIWAIWEKRFKLEAVDKERDTLGPAAKRPLDESWTGAEIRACCRVAAMMGTDLMKASQFIKPVAVTMKESIEGMREWAKGRAVEASAHEVRQAIGGAPGAARRRIG